MSNVKQGISCGKVPEPEQSSVEKVEKKEKPKRKKKK